MKVAILILAIFFAAPAAYPEESAKSADEEITALITQAADTKRLLTTQNRELRNKIDSLQKAIDDLREENAKLKEDNEKLTEDPGILSLRLSDVEKSEREWRAKAASFEKKCEVLSKEKEPLAKRNAALSAENVRIWANRSDLYAQIARLRSNILMMKKKQKNLLKEKTFAKNEAGILDARNKDLQASLLSANQEYSSARREKERMSKELVPVRKLKAKLASSYQQLGTAYAQLKHYDLAIDAYNNSLKYNYKNPVVHCNLGLLYEHSHSRGQLALYHLKKYLELNPDAVDKNEIMFIIKRLSEIDDGDIVFYN